MLEILKRRKRFSIRNKQSRKHTGKHSYKQFRIGRGVSKKYKSLQGKYTLRIRKITPARYNESGNLIGGGIFDYFKLKMNVRKIKNIIGKLNVLERHIKKEIDSYEVQAKQFKSIAEKAAEEQTKYIIAKRRNVILKNYRKDTEEINQKTDKNVMATIDSEIKRSDRDYKHAEKMVEKEYKEAGKDIKNFLYLSVKYQKELKKFDQIDELRKKVAFYQEDIANIRKKAMEAESLSNLGKAEKAAIAKYRANKADYDYVVSLTDQNMETVRKLQQRSSTLTTTMEFYKNQFGTYKREGYESKGAQGAIKVGSTLKQWADLTDKLAASLIGVYDNAKGIIATLEEVKKSIIKCRTILLTIPEYLTKDANANAILWFEHDVEDMIKVVKELKRHFGEMKNEFYNQIAAENMYSNYNHYSKFLRVIEIRLKFYKWMIDKAFTKDSLDKKREENPASGGYYNLIGGSRPSATVAGRQTARIQTQRAQGTNAGPCSHLTDSTPFATIKLKYLAQSLTNFTNGLNNSNKPCYNNLNKNEFIKCIENKFNRYLLAAFLKDNILDANIFNDNTNDELRNDIAKFNDIITFLHSDSTWDNATKKAVALKFDNFKPKVDLDPSIANSISSTSKITDLFDNAGEPKLGITNPIEKALQDYLAQKTYLKEFLKQLVSHTTPTDFYGVREYDKTRNNVINQYIVGLPPAAPAAPAGTTSAAGATPPAGTTSPAGATPAAGATPPGTTQPGTTQQQLHPKPSDKLNSNELHKIKEKINSIRVGLNRYGIDPTDDFNTIVDLLYTIEDSIDKIFKLLPNDNPVDIPIKGLDKYKEYLDNIKNKVDNNDVVIDIDNDDDDNIYEDMMDKLNELDRDYKFMIKFYDFMKREKTKAKDALKDLIEQYTKDINNKEAIGKIATKIEDKPEYTKKADTSTAQFNNTTSKQTPNTTSNPLQVPGVGISSIATNSISTIKEKEEKELKAKLEEIPPWLADLDTRSKHNKDYISNILIRIPKEYPNEYKAVKQEFNEMNEKLKGLIGSGHTLASLSENFQTMTTTLIDIKTIEVDLIDVKVKAEPKHFLGLGSYIPEPLSLEKKSQARNDTKKISELVKGMMQNTFFEDRGDKEKAKVNGANLFDKIFAILSKDHMPNISFDDQRQLRDPNILDVFLEKLTKSIANAGITSSIAAGQSSSFEIKESQMKFCRLINKLGEIVTDTSEVEKINKVSSKIGDCRRDGPILKKENKKGKQQWTT